MKIHATAAIVVLFAAAAFTRAADGSGVGPTATADRVGVYDSRAVAYAHFWSEPVTRDREARVARARAAKASGDTVALHALDQALAADQKRSHLQVFSTAPAEEAMAALAPRLPALREELGVARLVSKWDETALKDVPASARVEVTERLTRELFTPTEKQRKVLASMLAAKPLPLERARALAEAGKL